MAKEKNMKILGRCTIQKDGRFVIPKRVREVLGVGIGDTVSLDYNDDGTLTLTKA